MNNFPQPAATAQPARLELNRCPLFAAFNQVELSAMRSITQRSTIEAGTCVFREKQPGDSLVVILGGAIRITKQSPEGEDEEVAVVGGGGYFGEMALFGNGLRTATGTTLERTEAATVPYVTLEAFLEANPATAAKFYKAAALGMAHRLARMNESVAFLKAFLKAES